MFKSSIDELVAKQMVEFAYTATLAELKKCQALTNGGSELLEVAKLSEGKPLRDCCSADVPRTWVFNIAINCRPQRTDDP